MGKIVMIVGVIAVIISLIVGIVNCSGSDPHIDVSLIEYNPRTGETNHVSFHLKKGEDMPYDVRKFQNPEYRGYNFEGVFDAFDHVYITKDGKYKGKLKNNMEYKECFTKDQFTIKFVWPHSFGEYTATVLPGEFVASFKDKCPEGYYVEWYTSEEQGKYVAKGTDGFLFRPFEFDNIDETNCLTVYGRLKKHKYQVCLDCYDYLKTSYSINDIEINENVFYNSEYLAMENAITEAFATSLPENKYFAGWSLRKCDGADGEFERFDGTIKSTCTLYPIILTKTKIAFNGINKCVYVMPNKEYDINGIIDESLCHKNGYKFVGWYSNAELVGLPEFTINVGTEDVMLYPKYKKLTYEITFEAGDKKIPAMEYQIDNSVTLPIIKDDNNKKIFEGWCLKEDLSDEPMLVLDNSLFGDLVLYPKFTSADIEIKLDANGGTVEGKGIVNYCSAYKMPIPKYEGYKFLGWYSTASGNAVQYTNDEGESLVKYDSTEPCIMYARWSKYDHTITIYDRCTKKVVMHDYYNHGDTIDPSRWYRKGYIILGRHNEDGSHYNLPLNVVQDASIYIDYAKDNI